jgi:nitric oxide reductase NorE protein
MTATTPREAPARVAHPGRRIPGEEGIWVFVLGDMTVFAVFFATFMYSRGKNPDTFARDHASLNVALGTVNTVLLLTSRCLWCLPCSEC